MKRGWENDYRISIFGQPPHLILHSWVEGQHRALSEGFRYLWFSKPSRLIHDLMGNYTVCVSLIVKAIMPTLFKMEDKKGEVHLPALYRSSELIIVFVALNVLLFNAFIHNPMISFKVCHLFTWPHLVMFICHLSISFSRFRSQRWPLQISSPSIDLWILLCWDRCFIRGSDRVALSLSLTC